MHSIPSREYGLELYEAPHYAGSTDLDNGRSELAPVEKPIFEDKIQVIGIYKLVKKQLTTPSCSAFSQLQHFTRDHRTFLLVDLPSIACRKSSPLRGFSS